MKQRVKLCDVSNTLPHTELESFALIPEDIPRLLIIGETRTGKSSFCNKMAGVYYKFVETPIYQQKPPKPRNTKSQQASGHNNDDSDSSDSSSSGDDNNSNNEKGKLIRIKVDIIVDPKEEKEIFKSGSGQNSETQTTSWAQVNFLGNEKKPLIIIDTPGLNDISKEKANEHRSDLQGKLAALRRIDLVIIWLGKQELGGGGGFHNSTFDMLRDVIELFGGNTHLYKHFAIGFGCCDEFDKNWLFKIDEKQEQWQNMLQKEFFGKDYKRHKQKQQQQQVSNNINSTNDSKETQEDNINNENYEIPMFTLSNIQDSSKFNETKDRNRWSHYDQFKQLYKLCKECKKKPLFTTYYLEIMKMKSTIENIHSNKGLTYDESIDFLRKEILQYKWELRRTYNENVKYFEHVPKNASQGVVKCGETWLKSAVFGASCVLLFPCAGVKGCYVDELRNGGHLRATALTVGMSPLVLLVGGAIGAVVGASTIVRGVGSGIAALGDGIVNSITGNENEFETQVQEYNDENYHKHYQEVFQDCLSGKKTQQIEKLPFLKRLYVEWVLTPLQDCVDLDTLDNTLDKKNN